MVWVKRVVNLLRHSGHDFVQEAAAGLVETNIDRTFARLLEMVTANYDYI